MSNTETKALDVVELKAVDDGQPGEFTALVSTYQTDSVGDRVRPGAFQRSLSENGLPAVLYSHAWDAPPIGVCLEAKEIPEGLWVRGRFFVAEGEDSPLARAVYTALKAKDGNGRSALRKFSIGYSVRASTPITEDGFEIRELIDVDLYEVSVVLVPANQQAELLSVKTAAQVAEAVEHVAEAVAEATNQSGRTEPIETPDEEKPLESDPEINPVEAPEEKPEEAEVETPQPLPLDQLFPRRCL